MTSGKKTAEINVQCLGHVSRRLQDSFVRRARALRLPRVFKTLKAFGWKYRALSDIPAGRIVTRWHQKRNRPIFRCMGANCGKVVRTDQSGDKGASRRCKRCRNKQRNA